MLPTRINRIQQRCTTILTDQRYQDKPEDDGKSIDLTVKKDQSPATTISHQIYQFLYQNCEVNEGYVVREQLNEELQRAVSTTLPDNYILQHLRNSAQNQNLNATYIGQQTTNSPGLAV